MLGVLAAALLATGCAGPSPQSTNATANLSVVTPPVAASPLPNLLWSSASPTDAVARLLDYAEQVRFMPPSKLAQEVALLGNSTTPAAQVQLSLALSQMLQLPELIRAQELLGRVLADTSAEAQTLHPLAGLLASRYVDLRRLEDQLERQVQQTHEIQRRLDQANERMEALKAIERSLPSHRNTRIPAP